MMCRIQSLVAMPNALQAGLWLYRCENHACEHDI